MRREFSLSTETGRGAQWCEFAQEVLHHIDEYACKQYGDMPNDSVADWDGHKIVAQIERYAKRYGKNSRANQDELDIVKMAHYACMLMEKTRLNGPGEDLEESVFANKDIDTIIRIIKGADSVGHDLVISIKRK